MELEQRVKILEYELKILKNEIQRTLLDIQEQVLVHYYPSLRAEESRPTEGTVQAYETLKARAPAPSSPAPAASPVKSVPAGPAENSASPIPTIKPVSLDEIRAAQNELVSEEAAAAKDSPAAQKMLEDLVKKAGSLEEALKLMEEAKRG